MAYPTASAMFVKCSVKQNISISGRFGRSTLQFERKTVSASFTVDGAFRKRKSVGNDGPKSKSGDSGRDGVGNPVAGQLLHEPIQEARLGVVLNDDNGTSVTPEGKNPSPCRQGSRTTRNSRLAPLTKNAPGRHRSTALDDAGSNRVLPQIYFETRSVSINC